MFVTVTLPSYGRVQRGTGVPVDPGSYDYRAAARDAIHFSRLLDRLVQNCAVSPDTTCSTSPRSNRNGGWLLMRISRSGRHPPGAVSG